MDLNNQAQLNIRNIRLKIQLNEKRASIQFKDKENRMKVIEDKINQMKKRIQESDK